MVLEAKSILLQDNWRLKRAEDVLVELVERTRSRDAEEILQGTEVIKANSDRHIQALDSFLQQISEDDPPTDPAIEDEIQVERLLGTAQELRERVRMHTENTDFYSEAQRISDREKSPFDRV